MKRSRIVLSALTIMALTGCRDVGLQGNIPLADAEHKPLLPLQAEVFPAREAGHAGVMLDGTRWIDAGLPVEAPARDMREVGAGHGHPLYALRWDEPPFDHIYAHMADGRWQRHDPVLGVNEEHGMGAGQQ